MVGLSRLPDSSLEGSLRSNILEMWYQATARVVVVVVLVVLATEDIRCFQLTFLLGFVAHFALHSAIDFVTPLLSSLSLS